MEQIPEHHCLAIQKVPNTTNQKRIIKQTPDFIPSERYQQAVDYLKLVKSLLHAAEASVESEKAKASIKCGKCEAIHPIKDQTYIQTYWYTPPHGCTGGDYWNDGKANWQCPSCNFKNRFEDEKERYGQANPFHRPELVASKRHFKNIVEDYKK